MDIEKVPNVLVAFLTTYSKIKGQLTPQIKKEYQALAIKIK
jgi:hypothetical protein